MSCKSTACTTGESQGVLSGFLTWSLQRTGQYKKLMYAFLALIVLLNIFFIRVQEPHFALEKIPGFWAVFGVVATLLLGRVMKGAAHTFLGKDTDFYEKQ